MHGSRCRPGLRLRLARRPERGQRHRLHLGAGERGALDGLVGDQPQDRLQPVVAGVVQVVGLGGGEQQPVDAARERCADSQVLAPGRKHLRIASMRALQVGERVARPR